MGKPQRGRVKLGCVGLAAEQLLQEVSRSDDPA